MISQEKQVQPRILCNTNKAEYNWTIEVWFNCFSIYHTFQELSTEHIPSIRTRYLYSQIIFSAVGLKEFYSLNLIFP
jgi:hypothetical protein